MASYDSSAITTFEVDSSAVELLRYDHDREVLIVTYAGGADYEYAGVPFEIATAAAAAESVGRYVNTNIKGEYESFNPDAPIPMERMLDLADMAEEMLDELERDCSRAQCMSDPALDAIVSLSHATRSFLEQADEIEKKERS